MSQEIVIDATNALLGRLASYAAKQALLGKKVIIVNCDEAVISGNSKSIVEFYKIRRVRGGSSMKGPNFPRIPERIVKRTVRGMLPHHQERGSTAIKKVICFNGLPAEYKDHTKIKGGKEKPIRTFKLNELTKELS